MEFDQNCDHAPLRSRRIVPIWFYFQDIPILARIGADDRTVHPFYVRRMYRLMKEIKANITYMEINGKEHWWWDTK